MSDDLRYTLQSMLNMLGELLQGLRVIQCTMHGDILLAETPLFDEAKYSAELCVVAEFGVGIQRQMIGQQTDIVLQQMGDAALLDAGDRGIFAAPEIAVMNEDGIRTPCRGSFQHGLRGGHAGCDAPHLGPPFHLHTVRTVVTKTADCKLASDIIAQFVQSHRVRPHKFSGSNHIMRKFWLLFAQATTVGLAMLFVIHTLRPSLLPNAARSGVVTLYENNVKDGGDLPAVGFSKAAQKVMPAVVNVFTSSEVKPQTHPFMDDPRFRFFFGDQFEDNVPQQTSSLGSGVIVSHDGYILTNHHVIESADQIEVALSDGRTAKGHIVGSDPDTDLAVIKVDIGNNLPAITFAQSDQAHVGDIVLAVGNPFGVGQTVTMGIVSALKRNHLGLSTFENFIQTDAAINPGNSGGALVDVEGNLVGINSAIYSPNGGSLGIGFAIPVSTAKKIMEQIIQNGAVTRGWIGVAVQDLTPELLESFKLGDVQGVLIAEVVRGSPADKSGVKPGDILLSIADKPLTDSTIMLETISSLPPGKVTSLKLLRNQAEVEVQVKVGKRPKPKAQE